MHMEGACWASEQTSSSGFFRLHDKGSIAEASLSLAARIYDFTRLVDVVFLFVLVSLGRRRRGYQFP